MADTGISDAERENESILQFLYASPAGLIELSATGSINLINPAAMRLMLPICGYAFTANFFTTIAAYEPAIRDMALSFQAANGVVCENHRIMIDSGMGKFGHKPHALACTLIKLNDRRFIATLIDVTAQVEQERLLRQAESDLQAAQTRLALAAERARADREISLQAARFSAAVEAMSQALCLFDSAGGLIIANARFADMFGLRPDAIHAGMNMDVLLTGPDGEPVPGQTDAGAICAAIRDLRMIGIQAHDVCKLTDGRTLAVAFSPMDGGDWVITLEDITERKAAEAKINHTALHDALTGLPNRALFMTRLTEAAERAGRAEPSAILLLDLDHFTAVNDTFGRPTGDALLARVGARLQQQIREIDTVARVAGDEFAIVQSGVRQPQGSAELARTLIEILSQPWEVDGHAITLGASIGIAILPDDGLDPLQLTKNAEMAVGAAKDDGRGRYRFFEPAMSERQQTRQTLEADLRSAIARGEFEIYYQPLVNIKAHAVTGFEALVRWNHPDRGLVPPGEFIPLAEELGLIIPLGKWVLRQACTEAATWPADIKVAVNVSVIQFGSGTLADDVAAALHVSGLDPKRLDLEVTESVMADDTGRTLAIMHQLGKLGVGIAMDDFGTGYSSLNYLRHFPFSKVKIDRSFISDPGTDPAADAIVTAVTSLCATLGIPTVAEGVETREQLRHLRAGHCNEAQGYVFSQPRPAADVPAMCRIVDDSARVLRAG